MLNWASRRCTHAPQPTKVDEMTQTGRDNMAKLWEERGELIFAGEIRAGCWDHRSDVDSAISAAEKPAKCQFCGKGCSNRNLTKNGWLACERCATTPRSRT